MQAVKTFKRGSHPVHLQKQMHLGNIVAGDPHKISQWLVGSCKTATCAPEWVAMLS